MARRIRKPINPSTKSSLPKTVKELVPRRTWRAFCAAYAVSGNMVEAAEAAGVPIPRVRSWLKRYPEFADMLAEAEDTAADVLESEAVRRAKKGVSRPVLYRGKQIMLLNPATGKKEPLWETEYSDNLMMFLLRGFKPRKYGPKSVLDTTGGVPQIKEIEGATMDEV